MITKEQIVELRAKCEDGVFPIEKIPELLDEIERLKTKFNKTVRCLFCGKAQKRCVSSSPETLVHISALHLR